MPISSSRSSSSSLSCSSSCSGSSATSRKIVWSRGGRTFAGPSITTHKNRGSRRRLPLVADWPTRFVGTRLKNGENLRRMSLMPIARV